MPSTILKDNQKRCKKYRKATQKNNTEEDTEGAMIERYEAITHAPQIEF